MQVEMSGDVVGKRAFGVAKTSEKVLIFWLDREPRYRFLIRCFIMTKGVWSGTNSSRVCTMSDYERDKKVSDYLHN